MLEKFVDGRGEKWEGWMEEFLTYGWQRKHLDAGDILFHTSDNLTVGIEIKSVKDLTSRLSDARREWAQLIDTVNIPIFLVWGPWQRKSNDTLLGGQDQLTWGRLWNILQTFQDSGLRLQVCLSRNHAFLRINQLFAYYQKGEHTSDLVARKASSDRRIASLMSIPGISRKLGASLLKTFGSLRGIGNASKEELEQTSLIGPSRARVVYDYFEREEAL